MIEDFSQTTRVIEPVVAQEEQKFERSLRPKRLAEFIGQPQLVENLSIFMQAANKRKEPLEHVLFYGPPGLGKTTLSLIISQEMSSHLHTTSGPAIERQGDLAALLTNLAPHDVLFIDEIHRIKPHVEEILYSAMEDNVLDIMIGKGPTAKSMRIDIAPFTLVGATTKLSSLSSPLRDRFGSVMKLDFYNDEDLGEIILRSGKLMNMHLDIPASLMLARSARGTPRIANRLLRRVRDFADIAEVSQIDESFVLSCLKRLSVDTNGLDHNDVRLLSLMIRNYNGGPVGISTLAAALAEEPQTLEEVYEPYLLQQGFIQRTPRGRMITEKGRLYVGEL